MDKNINEPEICHICGQPFEHRHHWKQHRMSFKEYFDKYLKTENDGVCVVCGKPTAWNRFSYRSTCSIKCAANNQERKDKIKNTNLARYGVENAYKITRVQQNAIKAIKESKRNYKCLNCNKDSGIKKFCSETCKLDYINNGKSYNNRAQAKQTCIERFDGKMNGGAWETRRLNIEQFEKENNCTSTKKLVVLYGQSWLSLNLPRIKINKQNSAISNEYLPLIIKHSNNYHNSKIQQSLFDYIQSFYSKQIIQNDRQIIKPQELDIVLPELKLAIEFNGLRWHSIELGTNKNYHLDKSLKCREKGYRLIHIYEFEDLEEQKQLLKDLILGKDNYPKNDFNKNNLIINVPNPEIVYKNNTYTVYGAGRLY